MFAVVTVTLLLSSVLADEFLDSPWLKCKSSNCINTANPYNKPNYARSLENEDGNEGWVSYLEDEISTYHDVPLQWNLKNPIPSWIQGSLVKNGPGRTKFNDDRSYSNLLDSWGKIHKFTFFNETLKLSGRIIETTNYNRSIAKEHMVPCITLSKVLPDDWNIFEVIEAVQNSYDNTNVMVWKLGPAEKGKGIYITTTDYPLSYEIDPDTLAVKKELTLNTLTEGLSMASSAHWRREIGKDSSINFHVLEKIGHLHSMFSIWRFGDTWQDREMVAEFPVDTLPMIHMISVTEHYAVIIYYPVTVDLAALPSVNFHPMEAMIDLDEPTRIYLVDLRDGTVIDGIESSDPSLKYATHHANAWEEGDEIIVDLSSNPTDAIATYLLIEQMKTHNDTGADRALYEMKRVKINKKTKSVSVEDFDNELGIPFINTIDFTSININYTGKKNRYIYGWAAVDYFKEYMVKKDLEDSRNDKFWFTKNHYPAEPFFIPNPDGVDEDDGVVMSVVYDGNSQQSYLLLLDGKTLQEINFAYLPYKIPFSFHSNWFPEMY